MCHSIPISTVLELLNFLWYNGSQFSSEEFKDIQNQALEEFKRESFGNKKASLDIEWRTSPLNKDYREREFLLNGTGTGGSLARYLYYTIRNTRPKSRSDRRGLGCWHLIYKIPFDRLPLYINAPWFEVRAISTWRLKLNK